MVDTLNVNVEGDEFEKVLSRFEKSLDRILTKANNDTAKIKANEKRGLLQLDNQMKKERRMLQVATRVGGVGGSLGNLLQGYAQSRVSDTQQMKFLRQQQLAGAKLDPEQKKQLAGFEKHGVGDSIFDKAFNKFDKMFGEGSKWDDTFKGHGKLAAGGIAGGLMMGGAKLGKMIIDSSPAFQQLLKIMNYGIMLVLRPIGDFFAFLFRPILILLLRKFIIPFYQHVYPWFVKHGKAIGDGIASIADGSAFSGIGLIISESIKIKMAKLDQALADLIKPKTPISGELPDKTTGTPADSTTKAIEDKTKSYDTKTQKVADDIKQITKQTKPITTGKTMAMGANVAAQTTKKASTALPRLMKAASIANKVASAPANIAAGIIKKSAGVATKVIPKTVKEPAQKAAQKLLEKTAVKAAGKLASRAIPVVGQALLGIDVAGSALKQFSPETYDAIRGGAKGIFGDNEMTEGVLDFLGFGEQSTAEQIYSGAESLFGSAGGGSAGTSSGRGARGSLATHKMASGGIIKEPIFGFGKSGQRYMFGEAGREHVIPEGQMGGQTVINVNVHGNIMSEKDMLNFQRVIMRAVQSSNTRRARL